MRLLLLPLVLIVLHASAFASKTKQRHAQVVTAFDPGSYQCHQNIGYHNDLVLNLYGGNKNIVFGIISEPRYCSYNELVSFVNNDLVLKVAKVVVKEDILSAFEIRDFNQTVVDCVETVVENGKVVSEKVIKEVRIVVDGFLTGKNATKVKNAVALCR